MEEWYNKVESGTISEEVSESASLDPGQQLEAEGDSEGC